MKFFVKPIIYTLAYLGIYAQAPTTVAEGNTEAVTLYVSTVGNDRADGRSPSPGADNQGPFATLERARDELRALSGGRAGANVIVRGGTYQLQRTFQLESQDSGTAQAPVVYKPFEGEEVVLSGGRTLDNCVTTSAGRISCDTRQLQLQKLDARSSDRVRGPLPLFEVYVNGERLQLTRWPNVDPQAAGGGEWAHVTRGQGSRRLFSYSGEPRLSLRSANEAVLHIWPGNDWFDEYIGIQSMSAGNFTLKGEVAFPIQAGRRFSILNAEETLDAPGEWYYSTATEELRILPLPESKQQQPSVSYLETVITMRNAQNIRMQGFVVEQSRKTAITVTGGRSNTIANCTVRNTGGVGIQIIGGTGHTVTDSEIHDTSYGGLILEGGDRKSLVASNHTAIGNHIHDTGLLLRVGQAGLQLKGVGNIGRKNHIHHTPSMAVLIKGNDHVVEYNDIHHACEESADCGGVYVGGDWTYHGNEIRYNRVHDILGYGMKATIDAASDMVEYTTPHGARGIYLDDAASGINVVGNLLYQIPNSATDGVPHSRMVQIGGGRNNLIDNNVFVANGYAIWMDARSPKFPWENLLIPRLNAVPYKSSVWSNRYPQLAKPMNNFRWPEGNKITRNILLSNSSAPGRFIAFRYTIPPNDLEIDNNIIWNQGASVYLDFHLLKGGTVGIRDWATWQEMTEHDKNSLVIDPLFVSSSNGDFKLQSSSPARTLGIKELPLDQMLTGDNAVFTDVTKTRAASPPVAGDLRVD